MFHKAFHPDFVITLLPKKHKDNLYTLVTSKQSSGWPMRQVELRPFSQSEIMSYLGKKQIFDPITVRLIRGSGSVPKTLHMLILKHSWVETTDSDTDDISEDSSVTSLSPLPDNYYSLMSLYKSALEVFKRFKSRIKLLRSPAFLPASFEISDLMLSGVMRKLDASLKSELKIKSIEPVSLREHQDEHNRTMSKLLSSITLYTPSAINEEVPTDIACIVTAIPQTSARFPFFEASTKTPLRLAPIDEGNKNSDISIANSCQRQIAAFDSDIKLQALKKTLPFNPELQLIKPASEPALLPYEEQMFFHHSQKTNPQLRIEQPQDRIEALFEDEGDKEGPAPPARR